MSDAPERIWAKTYVDETKVGYWEGAPILPNNPENQGVEYLRADLHAARIEELERERDMERGRLAAKLKKAVEGLTAIAAGDEYMDLHYHHAARATLARIAEEGEGAHNG